MTFMLAPAYGAGGTGGGGGGGGPAMSAVASPATTFGAAATNATVTIGTDETLVTVTGGTAPFTYAWEVVSVSSGTWTINDPSFAATQFACSGVANGATHSASFRCKVTDAYGFVYSNTVTASVTNYGSFS